jgi:hypothetical protein
MKYYASNYIVVLINQLKKKEEEEKEKTFNGLLLHCFEHLMICCTFFCGQHNDFTILKKHLIYPGFV